MIRLLTGDCREVLKTLEDESIHCCVTSPPYLGLRDYNLPPTIWGGDPECEHEWRDSSYVWNNDQTAGSKQRTNQGAVGRDVPVNNAFCSKCGAWRGCLGLEPTPALYIAHLVEVFREVRRVLHPTGTVWLNLGDAYSSGGGKQVVQTKNASHGLDGMRMKTPWIAPKNLMMIPARVAIALQDDGWILRSEIVWAKKAPMPESVADRCTRSHEMVYMLTKNARYFCDMVAVAEQQQGDGRKRGCVHSESRAIGTGRNDGGQEWQDTGTRNLRDVWTLGPESFKGAHYAVFPTELARRCIAMGSSERGACPKCGAPWERVVEKGLAGVDERRPDNGMPGRTGNGLTRMRAGDPSTTILGWRPTCECGETATVPCVVLDPFAGSGTTLLVADRLGRDAIGIDLNPEYSAMQRERVVQDAPMFANVEAS